MRLEDFNYHLPQKLIAQKPAKPRDHSRLLVLDKQSGKIAHKYFFNLIDYLKKGDVLVLNNSKVFPARLLGEKATGGKIEVFLLKKEHLTLFTTSSPRPSGTPLLIRRGDGGEGATDGERGEGEVWQCLVKGGKAGMEVQFGKGLKAVIVKKNKDETYNVKFNKSNKSFMDLVGNIGQMPLPPYIKQETENKNFKKQSSRDKSYQTIYADDKKTGSVAAPTAGLHFTPRLIREIKKKGIQIEYITLHVGLGTFAPVKVDDITKHKMHAEWVEVDKETIGRIKRAKKEKRRIIAVGTTSARTLESVFPRATRKDFFGWVDIFIYPHFDFKIIDGIITNFHLPKSTLLMFVSALAGKENIDRAYNQAIKKKYRFFSFGDAMFIG